MAHLAARWRRLNRPLVTSHRAIGDLSSGHGGLLNGSVEAGDALDLGAFAAQEDGEAAALVGVDPAAEHREGDREGPRVLTGQRAPAVPEQDPALTVSGGHVGEAVGERVEVLPVVVGKVERITDRGE